MSRSHAARYLLPDATSTADTDDDSSAGTESLADQPLHSPPPVSIVAHAQQSRLEPRQLRHGQPALWVDPGSITAPSTPVGVSAPPSSSARVLQQQLQQQLNRSTAYDVSSSLLLRSPNTSTSQQRSGGLVYPYGAASSMQTPPHAALYARYHFDMSASTPVDKTILSPHESRHAPSPLSHRLTFGPHASDPSGGSSGGGLFPPPCSAHEHIAPHPADRSNRDAHGRTILASPSAHPRLLSLDAFRGVAIVLMILVSDGNGAAWNHALDPTPWEGLRLADAVWPMFLFCLGVSIPLAVRPNKVHLSRRAQLFASLRALARALALFALGFLVDEPGFPTQFNVSSMRVPGVLQRVAFVYLVSAMAHVWVKPRWLREEEEEELFGRGTHTRTASGNEHQQQQQQHAGIAHFSATPGSKSQPLLDGHPTEDGDQHGNGNGRQAIRCFLLRKYLWQLLLGILVALVVLLLLFLTPLPAEDGCTRGDLSPGCNAAREWDARILSPVHLLQSPPLWRSDECSYCSPSSCPKDPTRAPAFCFEPFDSAGVLPSIASILFGLAGLAFAYVMEHSSSHRVRVRTWIAWSLTLVLLGVALHVSGALALNPSLSSLSFVSLMVGMSGMVLAALYGVIECAATQGKGRKVLHPLICLGMNSLLVYLLAVSSSKIDRFIEYIYFNNDPTDNLVHWFRVSILQESFSFGSDGAALAFALVKIASWLSIATYLAHRTVFWKI